jgi:Resolvase, N terminal domain
VSFVSVTQQFNTTTSMGRLTLNVLLSFAQFEREVTSERIRDKIAASKRKGLWVGGPRYLGNTRLRFVMGPTRSECDHMQKISAWRFGGLNSARATKSIPIPLDRKAVTVSSDRVNLQHGRSERGRTVSQCKFVPRETKIYFASLDQYLSCPNRGGNEASRVRHRSKRRSSCLADPRMRA